MINLLIAVVGSLLLTEFVALPAYTDQLLLGKSRITAAGYSFGQTFVAFLFLQAVIQISLWWMVV